MKRKVVRERRAASGRIPIFFVYLNPKPYFFFFVCVCVLGGGQKLRMSITLVKSLLWLYWELLLWK